MAEGYKGKISNSGTQEIKALYPQTTTPKGNVVKNGTDLRVKSGGSKR